MAEVDLDRPKRGRTCNAGRSNLGVSAVGNTALCQMYFDQPLSRIGDGADHIGRMQAAGLELGGQKREGECASCQWQFSCAGACPRHAFDVLDAYQVPSPWCQTYKLIMPRYIDSVGRQMWRTLQTMASQGERR